MYRHIFYDDTFALNLFFNNRKVSNEILVYRRVNGELVGLNEYNLV